ncbi:PilZ domain-containing protein [Pseudomonas rhizosphaerae]|jgi:hypothetical protein|uniref:Pilus assembly protein n=1 Tax=Pseudomonas rhizosphaerae TaxID=216142 RepID=A0A089YNV2_9PSED|nr:PilZ domain-containing protein [Pseudomonas rhizosphaerae]AIS18123.1 pilus assembly protein [Pseudomonas rhizosphaerae]MBD8613837.1 PilZ domain-containing protein [Pseudomonas putida]MEB2870264.1 PilZ domain-containing protein [Pseudomonas rhizosphaerae]
MSHSDRDYSEKRDFIRMTVDAKVDLRVGDVVVPAVCKDLSSTGMQLEARTQLQVGDQVGVHLPSNHPTLSDLNVQAEVIRVEHSEQDGMQIVGLHTLSMD